MEINSNSLNVLISEYCLQRGDAGFNRAAIFRLHAVNALRELSMDFTATPKSVELPINQDDTVDYPCDFMNYISLSAVGQNGELFGLGKNTKINITKYFSDCGKPIRDIPQNSTVGMLNNWEFPYLINPTYYAGHYRNGENTGGYFNAGGHNTIGGYRFDNGRQQIILDAVKICYKCVVLEYIADVSQQDGDFVVHPFIWETVKRWISWQTKVDDRTSSLSNVAMAERNYVVSRKASMRRFRSSTTQEWLDAIRKANSGIPQF